MRGWEGGLPEAGAVQCGVAVDAGGPRGVHQVHGVKLKKNKRGDMVVVVVMMLIIKSGP